MPPKTAKQGLETQRIQQFVGKHLRLVLVAPEIEGVLPDILGAGEKAAIVLALNVHADLIILDDQEARRIATDRGLKVTGTIGVLVEARSNGILQSLRIELDRLIEAGMWISEVFYHRLLSEFQE